MKHSSPPAAAGQATARKDLFFRYEGGYRHGIEHGIS
jgi:hypothetical protein